MRVIYFDCFSGICGSMILGALIDAGLDFQKLKEELSRLNLNELHISAAETTKHSIKGTIVRVESTEKVGHRHLKDIKNIINSSSLDNSIKEQSIHIFTRLARAEAYIHNTDIEKIHFHEVGAIDAIADIVGSVIGLKLMRIEKVYSSKIPTGNGMIDCAHGKMPVPAPATAELLRGIPLAHSDIEGELTTPTGAAIISSLAVDFSARPEMEIESIGYGAGEFDFSIPNLLRVFIGKTRNESGNLLTDEVIMIATNIDDMNPEFYDYVSDSLYREGALEVFTVSAQMKKNRPGIILNVLTNKEKLDKILQIIFRETTTLGVRLIPIERRKLEREIKTVETEYGKVRIKIGYYNGQRVNLAPEYDDCYQIAIKHNIAVKEIYETARTVARKSLFPDK